MDVSGDGVVTIEDLKGVYNVEHHPKRKSGEWTANQVLEEFLNTFDSGPKDHTVSGHQSVRRCNFIKR